MRKAILMCILSATMCGCGSRAKRANAPETNKEPEVVVTTDIEAKETFSTSDIDKMVEDMLTDMYNNTRYEDYEWLESHCTNKCLKYLQKEYEYDCGEDPCYAVWKFRTSNQDGYTDEQRLVSVENVGNGYYNYTFIDMGFKGTNRVKVLFENNNLLIDEVINTEAETF